MSCTFCSHSPSQGAAARSLLHKYLHWVRLSGDTGSPVKFVAPPLAWSLLWLSRVPYSWNPPSPRSINTVSHHMFQASENRFMWGTGTKHNRHHYLLCRRNHSMCRRLKSHSKSSHELKLRRKTGLTGSILHSLWYWLFWHPGQLSSWWLGLCSSTPPSPDNHWKPIS